MYDWLTRSPAEDIEYDVDVLFGAWPSHPADTDLATVRKRLTISGIRRALVISTRGALFDAAAGNTETLAAASNEAQPSAITAAQPSATTEAQQSATAEGQHSATAEGQHSASTEVSGGVEFIPVGTVDLRDAVGVGARLDELIARGVRWLRLFTVQQGVQQPTPAYLHVVEEACARGLVLLHDGDPRRFGLVLAGRGAEVIFLDLHVYLLTDFLLMARDEPGFRITSRMLSSPDGIERVVETVGANHLVFGSRTPFMDISPQTLRLRYARISADDRALIAGGNIRALLEKVA